MNMIPNMSIVSLFANWPPLPTIQGSSNGVNQATQDRRWYHKMSEVGLVYGPGFKTLSNIRSTPQEGESIADVDMHITKGTLLEESSYLLHPTVIDGCLQLSIIAAHGGNPDNLVKSYLPTAIEHMTIFASQGGGAFRNTAMIRGFGKPKGLRSIDTSVELTDTNGNVMLEAALTFMSLESSINSQSEVRVPQPYSRLVWKPSVSHLSNTQLAELCVKSEVNQYDDTLFTKLEELAALSVLSVSEHLDSNLNASLPHHIQRFFSWLIGEALKLSATEIGSLSRTQREERIQLITNELSREVPETAMITTMSKGITEIISGTADNHGIPVEGSLMNKVNQEGLTYSRVQDMIGRYMELIAHSDPRLNILEVGAEMTGPSKRVLSALRGTNDIPNYIKYHFAQPSTKRLENIRELYADYRNLQFDVLDIDNNKLPEGFEEHLFDVILISTVSQSAVWLKL
jgi:hypothetical protein